MLNTIKKLTDGTDQKLRMMATLNREIGSYTLLK